MWEALTSANESPQVTPFELFDGIYPFLPHLNRGVLDEVEADDDRAADALDLTRGSIDKTLDENETLMADVRHRRLDFDVGVRSINLRKEISVNMRRHRYVMMVDRNAEADEVVHLRRIIILEIHRVVDVTELVGIEETQLKRKLMMEFNVCVFLYQSLIVFLIHYSSDSFKLQIDCKITKNLS